MSDAASAPLTPEQIRDTIREQIERLQNREDGPSLLWAEQLEILQSALTLLDSQALALTRQQQEIERLKAEREDMLVELGLKERP